MATIVDAARRAGVSIATVSRVISRPDVVAPHTRRQVTSPSVHIDNHADGFDAMEHLCRLGHRRIAVVTGPREMGQEVVRLLLAFIRGEPVTPVSVIVRHPLTVCDGTGPAVVA